MSQEVLHLRLARELAGLPQASTVCRPGSDREQPDRGAFSAPARTHEAPAGRPLLAGGSGHRDYSAHCLEVLSDDEHRRGHVPRPAGRGTPVFNGTASDSRGAAVMRLQNLDQQNFAVIPPSTTSSVAVTYLASSEAKKRHALATSQASPIFPVGHCALRIASIFSRSPPL